MQASESVRDLIWPGAFVAALGYTVWYFPRFILSLGLANDAIASQYSNAGPADYLVLLAVFFSLFAGIRRVRTSPAEGGIESGFDRIGLFFGRVSMVLIALLVAVMFYEVIVRYVFERPTLWANELSLWIAGFVFLLSGLYAMQQRSHIRIYLFYDAMPRPLQKAADILSVALIAIFAVAMIWGGFDEVAAKVLRWETFGTAFNPPIPATLKPAILIVIVLVALQSFANLICDWCKKPEHRAPVDESELEELRHDLHGRAGGPAGEG